MVLNTNDNPSFTLSQVRFSPASCTAGFACMTYSIKSARAKRHIIAISVPVFLKKKWGYQEYYYGLLSAFNCLLIVLAEMPLIHSIEKNGFTRFSLQLGLLLTGASFLFFLLPGYVFVAVLMMFVFTLGEILYMPLNNAQSIKLSPSKRRSAYISWYWMTWSLTNIAGPSLGLLIADKLGYPALWIVLFGIVLISLFINRWIQKH